MILAALECEHRTRMPEVEAEADIVPMTTEVEADKGEPEMGVVGTEVVEAADMEVAVPNRVTGYMDFDNSFGSADRVAEAVAEMDR